MVEGPFIVDFGDTYRQLLRLGRTRKAKNIQGKEEEEEGEEEGGKFDLALEANPDHKLEK